MKTLLRENNPQPLFFKIVRQIFRAKRLRCLTRVHQESAFLDQRTLRR